jgi:hypothetical protein
MAHRFQLPRAFFTCVLLSLLFTTAGCKYMPCVGGYGNCAPPIEIDPEAMLGNGPCLPAFGSDVVSADMNAAGNRILTVTDAKPASLPEDAGWPSDSRALTVIDLGWRQCPGHRAAPGHHLGRHRHPGALCHRRGWRGAGSRRRTAGDHGRGPGG